MEAGSTGSQLCVSSARCYQKALTAFLFPCFSQVMRVSLGEQGPARQEISGVTSLRFGHGGWETMFS